MNGSAIKCSLIYMNVSRKRVPKRLAIGDFGMLYSLISNRKPTTKYYKHQMNYKNGEKYNKYRKAIIK